MVLVFDNDNVKYDHPGYKLSFQDWNKVELLRRKHGMVYCSIPLCPPGGLDLKEFDAMEDMFHIQVKDKIFGEDWLECFATEILDAKYDKTDVAEVMKGLTQNAHQKADLLQVLPKNNKMFNGTLGVYPHKKVHIDIDPNAKKPVHSRPYPVP
jgi:hypothetical protein